MKQTGKPSLRRTLRADNHSAEPVERRECKWAAHPKVSHVSTEGEQTLDTDEQEQVKPYKRWHEEQKAVSAPIYEKPSELRDRILEVVEVTLDQLASRAACNLTYPLEFHYSEEYNTLSPVILEISVDGNRLDESFHENFIGLVASRFKNHARVFCSRIAEMHHPEPATILLVQLFNTGSQWLLGVRISGHMYYVNRQAAVVNSFAIRSEHRGYRGLAAIPAIYFDNKARGF